MATLIFDIDGTLLDSEMFDSELYIQAVKEVLGDVDIQDDWGKYKDTTDPGIVYQIIHENKIPGAKEKTSQVRKRFGELIASHFKDNPCKPLKGAIDEIHHLARNANHAIGMATGGWGHTAAMKLHSAGFSHYNIPLFSADHHHERTQIMKACKEHISPSDSDIVYVGDGLWDIKATQKLQWGFVGIGNKLKEKTEIWIADCKDKNWGKAPAKVLTASR